MVRLEIVPDNLDVVELGAYFGSHSTVSSVWRLDGFTSELADMDRPVVLDQYDRFYCPSWLRPNRWSSCSRELVGALVSYAQSTGA